MCSVNYSHWTGYFDLKLKKGEISQSEKNYDIQVMLIVSFINVKNRQIYINKKTKLFDSSRRGDKIY